MHTWLPSSLLGRVVASVRRMVSLKGLALLAIFAVLAVALPMAFAHSHGQNAQPQSTQQQPVAMASLQAGTAPAPAANTPAPGAGGEANLTLPDMSTVSFLNDSIDGHKLLMIGILFCFLGGLFGLVIYMQLKNLPVHRSMREISELIYETCKTYLTTQGKFILILEAFIAVIIVLYFGVLEHLEASRVIIILLFSLVGIAGSYGVAWFGIRVNTFANSRTAFAGLRGKP